MAPSGDAAELKSSFEEMLGNLLPDGREEMVEQFNRMVDNFNDAWWKQGVVVRWLIKRAIDEMSGHVERLLEVVDEALDHYIPVLSLFETSIQWTDDAMTPLSEIYADIPPGSGNRNLVYWDDAARKVYDQIVTEQQGATGAARDLAAYMSRWLSDIGQANVSYATHLVRQVGEVVGQLTQAAVEAGSIIASPFALQDAAGIIGQAVTSLFDTLGKIGDDVAAAVDRVIDADNELSNHSHFPGGKWPLAVTRAP